MGKRCAMDVYFSGKKTQFLLILITLRIHRNNYNGKYHHGNKTHGQQHFEIDRDHGTHLKQREEWGTKALGDFEEEGVEGACIGQQQR